MLVKMVLYVSQCACFQDPLTHTSEIADNYKTKVFKTGFGITDDVCIIAATTHTFEDLVCGSRIFVDNSLLIWYFFIMRRLVVTLPRAFGKTINLDMVMYFYRMEVDVDTLKPIPQNETRAYQTFVNSMIKCNGRFKKLQDQFLVSNLRDHAFYEYLGSTPVIHLNIGQPSKFVSFKSVCLLVKHRLELMVDKHGYIMCVSSSKINPKIVDYQDSFKEIKASLDCDSGDGENLINVMPQLTNLLYEIFRRRVFVFIDEYDAVLNGIYFGNSVLDTSERTKIISFFASLYGSIVKQENCVQRVFMTGILCWRGCQFFSSIDRMDYHTVSGGNAVNFYGINGEIVGELLTTTGINYTYATVMKHYNGYNFGKSPAFIVKYNPYAIARFVAEKGNSTEMNFWSGSSSVSSMLRYLIRYQKFNDDFMKLILQPGVIKIRGGYGGVTTFTHEELNGFSDAICKARDAHESEWFGMKSSNDAEQFGFNILLVAGYLTECVSPPYNFEETQFAYSKFIWVRVPNEELRNDLLSTYIPIVRRNEYGKCPPEEIAHWRSVLKTCGDQLAYDLQNDFPNLRDFALAFENVIEKCIPITWQIRGNEPKAYGNEAIFETLLTTVVNYHIFNLGLKRLETQHQFEYKTDERRPDIVFQYKNILTIFELKYCRGNSPNVKIIRETLQNATTQALGYAKWYLCGKHRNLYQVSSVRVVVLLVTECKKRVVIRTAYLLKDDDVNSNNWEKNLNTEDHWPDSF